MPRKGQRLKSRKTAWPKPPGPATEHHDPFARHPLTRWMEEHFEWMRITGYSEDTIRARRIAIKRFIRWCDERGLEDPREITKPILDRYQRSLFYYRKDDGRPMTLGSQHGYLAPLKTFFKWLARALQPGERAAAAEGAQAPATRAAHRAGGRGDPRRGRSVEHPGPSRSGDARGALLDGPAADGIAGACTMACSALSSAPSAPLPFGQEQGFEPAWLLVFGSGRMAVISRTRLQTAI
jgi:hypothetical protein